MKTTTILTLTAACITPMLFNSCALDPEYSEWKKNNQGAAATANPYGVPQEGGESGTYTPAAGNAPYQPLPGVSQPTQPTDPLTPADPLTPPAPTAGASAHTVVSGDSLWGIARKYGTTIEAIQAANGLTNTTIRTGQQLSIPGR